MLKTFAFALLAVLPAGVFAQTVTKQNEVTATVTITAIDQATRSVTLRAENGDTDTFTVGPAVKRFAELKVGDVIRATYYESLVFQLRKPGAAAAPASSTSAVARLTLMQAILSTTESAAPVGSLGLFLTSAAMRRLSSTLVVTR